MRKESDSLPLKKKKKKKEIQKHQNNPLQQKALIKAKLSLRAMLLLYPVLQYRVCSRGPSLFFLFWSVFLVVLFFFLRTTLQQSF